MELYEQTQQVNSNTHSGIGYWITALIVLPFIIGVISLAPTFLAWLGWTVSYEWVGEIINYPLPKANFWGIWGIMLVVNSVSSTGNMVRSKSTDLTPK